MMQIYFKKDGSSDWLEYGPVRNLYSFNRDFYDWIFEYYNEEQCTVKSWVEALEVLNTVGASAKAGYFKLEEVL